MASITTESNGRRTIQFCGVDGKRHSFRLGKATDNQAKSAQAAIEQLVSGGALDPDSRRWLADLSDTLHERLARLKLVAPRESLTLGVWIPQYLAERTDFKPAGRRGMEGTGKKLLAFFGADKRLRDITPEDASDWRASLSKSGLAIASVKSHCTNAKRFLNRDREPRFAFGNPFKKLKGGTTAAENERYVTPDEAARVIEYLPTTQLRALFGLARWGGLRSPSETHAVCWAHVDWQRGRLTTPSPKTEHYGPAHASRVVPSDPRLMPLLQAAFDEAEEGEERIITLPSNSYIEAKVRAAIKAAEVRPWARIWQTLRVSCEIEWATQFPAFVAAKWLGHSPNVQARHYTNIVPNELFDKAAMKGAFRIEKKAVQIPVQQGTGRIGRFAKTGRLNARNGAKTNLCESAKPLRLAAKPEKGVQYQRAMKAGKGLSYVRP